MSEIQETFLHCICVDLHFNEKINANLGKRIGGYGSYFYFNLYVGIMIVSLDRMYII